MVPSLCGTSLAKRTGLVLWVYKGSWDLKRYETVWIWLHKLRSAMVRPGRDRLSGIVEVDETYIGGQEPGKRGRGAGGKILVVIAVEDKGTCFGRIRLRRVVDASAKSLVPAVQESVVPGSVVRTDGWSGYVPLPSEEYKHLVVRPSDEVGENMLPLAHRVASLLKRWLAWHAPRSSACLSY